MAIAPRRRAVRGAECCFARGGALRLVRRRRSSALGVKVGGGVLSRTPRARRGSRRPATCRRSPVRWLAASDSREAPKRPPGSAVFQTVAFAAPRTFGKHVARAMRGGQGAVPQTLMARVDERRR